MSRNNSKARALKEMKELMHYVLPAAVLSYKDIAELHGNTMSNQRVHQICAEALWKVHKRGRQMIMGETGDQFPDRSDEMETYRFMGRVKLD